MHDFTENAMTVLVRERFLEELRTVNETSVRYGLSLSENGMRALVQARNSALIDHGRVELGSSAVCAIADGFCDSPYLLQEDYETTLLDLVDAFYYFKNACADRLTDDELIYAMRLRYDAFSGSVDAVIGTTLEAYCRAIRFGDVYDKAAVDHKDEEDENDGLNHE
jgi:hypothetical protein